MKQDQNNKKKSGVPMNDPTLPTSSEAGSAAHKDAADVSNNPVPAPVELKTTPIDTSLSIEDQLKQAEANQAQISDQGAAAAQVLGQLLKAKKQAAPYDESIQKIKENIGAKNINEYLKRGIPLDRALNFMNQDYARADSKIGYFRDKQAEAEQESKDILANVADYMNTLLAGTTLQVQNLTDQRNFEYQKKMDEQAYQLQLAAMARSGRGSDSSSSDKETEAFYKDIATMQTNLSSGKLDWGQAWNYMASKYGAEGGDVYDSLLDKEKWAQPGAYEAQAASRKSDKTPEQQAFEEWLAGR